MSICSKEEKIASTYVRVHHTRFYDGNGRGCSDWLPRTMKMIHTNPEQTEVFGPF